MTFAEHMNAWFDALSMYGHRFHKGQAMTYPVVEIYNILKLTPNRRNLTKLRDLIKLATSNDGTESVLRRSLIAHIDAILDRQFKSDFLCHFNSGHITVSAASEFFNQVRQALDYHKNNA